MLFVPLGIVDVDRMIEAKIQESIHLDYKDSRAADPTKPVEIAKDVSSFANSDGGVIVYGVEEERGTGYPLRSDEGVDLKQCSKERLENIITSHVTPLHDFRIEALPLDTGRVLFVVEIAKSFSGPHQASDRRYYKRYNFKSVPMEDYEINDIRNRPKRIPPLVTFDAACYGGAIAVFDLANVGEVTAEDVRFSFSTALPWPEDIPYILKNGIHRMPPRQKFRFLYHQFPDIFKADSGIPAEFSVAVSYFHPDLQSRQSFEWHINLNAYRDAMIVRSDAELYEKNFLEELKKLNENLKAICSLFGRGMSR